MAFTFTTLKTAIQDYTQNTESTFVSQLSRFIINAEERILKECQLDVFRKSSQGSATSGNQYLSKPSDFLSDFFSSTFFPFSRKNSGISSGFLSDVVSILF